jgi:hypothetical protein
LHTNEVIYYRYKDFARGSPHDPNPSTVNALFRKCAKSFISKIK